MSVPHATNDVDQRTTGFAPAPLAVLRLFAGARQAAGTGRAEVAGATVGDVLSWARSAYGPTFSAVLDTSGVWRNGEPATPDTAIVDGDEVAVLPPVSGGAVLRTGSDPRLPVRSPRTVA